MDANDKGLENWSWDDDLDDIVTAAPAEDTDFADFSEPIEEEELEPTVETVEEEEEEEVEDSGEESEVEEATEEVEEVEEAADEFEVDEKKLFGTVAEDLKSRGYDLNFEDGEEITEEKFFDKFAEFADTAVKGSIDMWKDSLPDEAKEYIRFVSNGGTPEDFYKQVGAGSWRSYDISTDSGAEMLVRHYLKNVDGLDDDAVDEEIEALSDLDRLGKKAEFYDKKLKEESQAQLKARNEQMEQMSEQRAQAEKARLEKLSNTAKETKEFNGYQFDARRATNALTRNTVKVGDRYVPEFAAKFQEIWTEAGPRMLFLADLVVSGFDLSPIERTAETKATRKTRDLIKKGKQKQKSRVSQAKNAPVWEVGDF